MRRVAHDIRTPLAVVKQGIEQLVSLDDVSDEGAQRLFNIVRRNVVLMGEVLAGSLMVSTRALMTNTTEVDLAELARDVVDLIRPVLDVRGQRVDVKSSGGHALVLGDHGRLARVLLNLLDNASKYGPAGDVLQVRVARRKNAIVVSVHDHGPGIPPGERHAIFRAFYRTEDARRSDVAGAGLGLAVVRELVAEHQGSVGVACRRGETRVWFSIPITATKGQSA